MATSLCLSRWSFFATRSPSIPTPSVDFANPIASPALSTSSLATPPLSSATASSSSSPANSTLSTRSQTPSPCMIASTHPRSPTLCSSTALSTQAMNTSCSITRNS
ncbi:hypothetical protein MUK42_24081 [Musa troglodytarum]|uniref:Uncharacterized protein n=1 Tax=Musa troglodytarum TaxID=320322 RepID=A0A9E7KAW4_9LILI|nr:hypothetical protein MUK42_24081 [Musa troglodytarum]